MCSRDLQLNLNKGRQQRAMPAPHPPPPPPHTHTHTLSPPPFPTPPKIDEQLLSLQRTLLERRQLPSLKTLSLQTANVHLATSILLLQLQKRYGTAVLQQQKRYGTAVLQQQKRYGTAVLQQQNQFGSDVKCLPAVAVRALTVRPAQQHTPSIAFRHLPPKEERMS